MNEGSRLSEGYESCECCAEGLYDGEPYSDEPWCVSCGHSPEEHGG